MKRLLFHICFVILLIIIGCSKDTPEPLPESQDLPHLFVAGYLPHWGMGNFDETALNHIDRVYYFSLAPDVDGQFEILERDRLNLLSLGELTAITDCELFIVIGGWYESENIHIMASSAEKRQAYISEMINLCQTYNLDGVDLDWENYPYPFDIDDFIDLVNEMSYALREKGLGFTVALDRLHYNLATRIIGRVDAVNLMLYGMLDENGNHSTLMHMKDGIAPFLGY